MRDLEMHDRLRSYGWSRFFENHLTALDRPALRAGRVVEAQRGSLRLETAQGPVEARLSGRGYHLAADAAALPVVGDWVAFQPEEPGQSVLVHEILPRRTRLSRKAAGARAVEQVVAANVDLVLLVMGLDGDYNLKRLERLLAMAEESGARPAVVLNKADLPADLEDRLAAARALCYGNPIVAVSALDGDLASLEPLLIPGETAALVGSSGAGKSTLIHRLMGSDELTTRPVRADDSRGRHTTTHRELFRLPGGCLVIDNPGVREIQLWDAEQALSTVFDDIDRLASNCRFSDCRHDTEPGCAVRRAIDGGELDGARLERLQKLERETAALARRKDLHAQRQQDKRLGKLYKSILREKRERRGQE
jgi:ribosome biogenesis GTPase